MKKILFFAFVLSFASCKKELFTFTYNETQCADAWTKSTAWFEPNTNQEALIKAYLTDSLGVNITEFKRTDEGQEAACLECSCASNKLITIKAEEDDEAALVKFGFVKQ